MSKKSAVCWGVVTLLALAVTSGWAQDQPRRQGGGQGRGQGGFGNFVQGSLLSAEMDSGKVLVLTTNPRGGGTEGIHPAALDEAAKQLRAKADASADAAEAGTLRAGAKQLEALHGQTTTLAVAPDAVVQSVKLLTAKDIAVESRIQFSGEFEEGLPEGQTPATVAIARGFGNAPPMIWTAPREAQTGMQRWGQLNRGMFVGQVTAASPLTVDIGNGKTITVTIPKNVEVRYLLTKGTSLDALKAGMSVVATTSNNDGGVRTVSRLYAGDVDMDQLGLGFLFGGGGNWGGNGGGNRRGQ